MKLPADFEVLKDEYHDMWQDYCILYDIQFDSKATAELIKKIQATKFYNPNVNIDSVYYGSLFIKVGDVEAVWRESENGYSFSGREGSTRYSIELDTSKNILNYNECLD